MNNAKFFGSRNKCNLNTSKITNETLHYIINNESIGIIDLILVNV